MRKAIDFSDEVWAKIKARAKSNHRSFSGEVLHIVELAVEDSQEAKAMRAELEALR
jgi:hypothetical protein